VTIGRPVSARTRERIFSPSAPRPWNEYGEVRGLKAPDLERPPLRLDGAGPGRQDNFFAADLDAADRHDRVLALGLAGHQLVRRGDGYDLRHTRQVLEGSAVDGTAVAGDADRRALRARDGMRLQAQTLYGVDDAGDVLRGGRRIHHDEHRGAII
jgi:hypothetical protein